MVTNLTDKMKAVRRLNNSEHIDHTLRLLVLLGCTMNVLGADFEQKVTAASLPIYSAAIVEDSGLIRRTYFQYASAGRCTWGNDRFVGNLFVRVSNGPELMEVTYPAGSHRVFAFVSLQLGGVKGEDTLVSTGSNFSLGPIEYYPSVCGGVERLSPRARDRLNDIAPNGDSALSDYDVSVKYADTLTDPQFILTDPIDGRKHKPLGVEVSQRSFSWVSGPASNCMIVEYQITNINGATLAQGNAGTGALQKVFVGFNAWIPAGYDYNDDSFRDNLIDFVRFAKSPVMPEFEESLDAAWIADNDGDPGELGFGLTSIPDAVAVSILRPPTSHTGMSFNWWAGSLRYGTWGPVQRGSKVEFMGGELGRPQGDRSVYQMMANSELDYPQLETAINHEARGWFPPPIDPVEASDIASGAYVQFLLSIGPFDLPVDSTVTVAIAVVGGKEFHTAPANFHNYFDPLHPDLYRSRLNMTSLLSNVQWAKWTYDNPGIDTDGDGYAGEWFLRSGDTVYYRGDGVPDIRAALPPRTPSLTFDTRSARVAIHWNGYRTETEEDVFTQRPDFEGYRIYMSRTGREDEWLFLSQRDLLNYARFTWNGARDRWEMNDPPYSLDSLKRIYDTLTWSRYGFLFHPDRFPVPILDKALLEVQFDPDRPERLDSVYRYFAPYEANNQPDDLGLFMAAESGVDVAGVVRRLHPQALPTDTAYREDGTSYLPFYEYEYVLKDLQVAEPVFLSVTAFDHGDPASGLEPLESSKSITAREVWPINSSEVVESVRPKPGVYPNPYRLIDSYYDNNWENRRGLEPDRERARQVTFYNVPDTCVLSIYTLDGDLVKRLQHSYDPSSSEATVVRWNLITRNTQAVKTGIYIWSVESRFGTDVGKLIIIK